MVALVAVAGVVIALVAGGGGKHERTTLADADFWNTANSAVRDLAAADQLMQAHLAQGASPASADQLEADGVKVISYADAASTKLRSLTHPSTAQVTYIEARLRS